MKAIEQCTYRGFNLAVLIEPYTEPNDSRDNLIHASYFINGMEITEWKNIKPGFQNLLSAMLNQYCEDYELIKWSY
jgi:hypothetical protein